jgi:hypothetical protein
MVCMISFPGKSAARVPGKAMIDWAKMMGMTPALFTRRGMCVVWPPYIFRPTTRLAYWTGIFRSPSVMRTTSTITAAITTPRMMSWKMLNWPDIQARRVLRMALG